MARKAIKRKRGSHRKGGKRRKLNFSEAKVSNASEPITFQTDVRNQYRRKRISKYKLKKKKRFNKLVTRIIEHHLPQQVYIRNSVGTNTAADNSQGFFGFMLYGPNGAAGFNNDIFQLLKDLGGGAPQASDKITTYGAWCDIELSNLGPADAWIDAYKFTLRKDVFAAGTIDKVDNLVSTEFSYLATTVGQTALSGVTLGSTPFDCPPLCRYMKIHRMDRIYLKVGSTTNLELKDRKIREHNGDYVVNHSLGVGQIGYLFMFNGTTDGAKNAVSTVLGFNYTRKYHYTFEGLNDYGGGTS